jgi:predicted nucleotidyltransferase
MELQEQTKLKIINVIQALIPQADIYLFGSRATGQNRPYSDIDIALDAGHPLDRLDVGEVRDMLNASNMPYSFDIVDLQNIGVDFKNNIIAERVLWAKRK